MRIRIFTLTLLLSTSAWATNAYEECSNLARSETGALSTCMTQRLRLGINAPQKTVVVVPVGWQSAIEPPLILRRELSGLHLGAACLNRQPSLCWPASMGENLKISHPTLENVVLEGQVERSFRYACMAFDHGFAQQVASGGVWQIKQQPVDLSEVGELQTLLSQQCD